MMRVLHPARLLRYVVYTAVFGTVAITTYTLFNMIFEKPAVKRTTIPYELIRVQDMLSYIGDNLSIKYEIQDHVDYRTRGKLTFENAGTRDIVAGNWSVYMFYMSPIDTDLLNYGSNPEPWFRIYRMQGNLYRMTPTSHFKSLHPGDTINLEITSGTWIMAYTDILPNWYVWTAGLEPHIIKCTLEDSNHDPNFVEPFSPSASVRVEGDPFPPFTPEKRFQKNKINYEANLGLSVLPTPLAVENRGTGEETLSLSNAWVIVALPDVKSEAKILQEKLGLEIVATRPSSKYIQLTIGNVPLPLAKYQHRTESYYVDVNKEDNIISIVGQSPPGVFYGMQTVISMYKPETKSLPVVKVSDAPRFIYRGIMMDLSRNFHSNKTEILRVLDALAMYKMNKLHLHLGDDEGWRLEIPGLPELTQIGAHRCHDLRETHCIVPALGSGPYTNSSGSGYISVEDYREILEYAGQRHIEVIPEFDMPGHGRAAIRSMDNRYHKLLADGKTDEAKEFLLSDPTDRSMYMSGQFFTDNAINPCMESTYRFVEHLIVEVQKLHENIYPLSRFHFGGDEVPENAYMDSPACQNYMSSHPELLDTRDLKIHFIKRITAIAARHNIGVQGWEDAFYGKDVLPMDLGEVHSGKNVVTNVWWNMWEGGIGHRANELANNDYKVVLSHSTHFYFDHVQEPDPAERGLYWSIRYIDTKRVFGYMPDDIYDNIDMRGMGEPWSKEEACSQLVNCVPLKKPENVIGLQAQLWAETVRSRSHQNFMLFPRVLALAERAWHQASWETANGEYRKQYRQQDWARFATIVGTKELKRLEEIDIHYRLPPPGVFRVKDQVKVNTELPGVTVQFSVDDGHTWQDWDESQNTQLNGKVLFASRSFDHKRRSRPVSFSM